MRFLVDECTGPAVAAWLRSNDHDVYSVYDESPGMDKVDLRTAEDLSRYFRDKVVRAAKVQYAV